MTQADLAQTLDAVRRLAQCRGLTVAGETALPYGRQLKLTDGCGAAAINIYQGKKGISLVVTGSPSLAVYAQANNIRAEVLRRWSAPPPEICQNGDASADADAAAAFGLLGLAGFDYRWIGTDESGKGDYFGPLVAAGMYVDATIAQELTGLGVADSKTLSDGETRRLAGEIRRRFPDKFEVVEIPPAKYNALYEQFKREGKNLNSLLAWGHARVLENLLIRCPCRFALTDKFADARYVEQRLFAHSRRITLVQRPRAERNVAVAAASVLARDSFLTSLDKLSAQYGLSLPKGAAPQVVAAARDLVTRHGAAALGQVAKLHFKITAKVSTIG